ncbi:MAG: TonB-dependent receptor [Alphaproteobacteria bacterium]|nr:TonB-dependent receptor [Alphaproteobacteria bacterium]
MNKTRILNTLLATTFIGGAIGIATPAYAQTTPPADQPRTGDQTQPQAGPAEGSPSTTPANGQGDENGAIVVTGTRIPQPNLTSASPITVVNNAEVKLQGTARTEDIINSLPQSFAAQGSNISNGATGTATVDLRGLGSRRTLVLVNGRRLMPGDPRSPVPDINFIPALAVDRIDVLTGGASSVYGADAVAGVVNFVMDTKFEGVRMDAQYSFFDHVNNDNVGGYQAANAARGFVPPIGHTADGGTVDASLVMGAGFDDGHGHITAYATYRRQHSVLQRDRDYSFCSLSDRSPAQAQTLGRNFNCGGSGTSANGTFLTNVGTFQVGAGRVFIPNNTPFNFGPYNYFQRPDERYTFGAFADYEISSALHPYMEAMFMDDRSVAQIAPSGDFFNTTDINCDNPLLSAQQRSIVCSPANLVGANPVKGVPTSPPTVFTDQNGNPYFRGVLYPGRRNVEGGGRRDDLQHTDYRIVAGMRGDLGGGFSYDASYQYGRVVFAQTYFNDFSVTRLNRALDVVTGANGQPVCRSVLTGADPNCVPYDIFAPGGVTAAALNYLQTPGFSRGNTQETVATASITAQLGEYGLQSPWANHGLAINVGGEYRKEKLEFSTDQAFSTGDLAGQGGATIGVNGQYHVKEAFTEVQLPLVEDRPFFQLLEVRGGYRYSKYQVAANKFSTDTWKIEGEWAPIRDVKFRASVNRAVRAPNIVELFSAQSVALDGSTDPCSGPAVNGRVNGSQNGPTPTDVSYTAAQCALTGVTAAQFGNVRNNVANQYNGLQGGNPNLTPEKADSFTAGIVLQPRWLPRFALSVDYFNIRVKNSIGAIGADTILKLCLQTGDPFYCGKIHRGNGGTLYLSPQGYVEDVNVNAGGLSTRGVDVNMSYTQPLPSNWGSLAISMVGTYLSSLTSSPDPTRSFNCAGFFGSSCGTPAPKWRHKLRLTYTAPGGIGLSGQWRHFSAVRNDAISPDIDLNPTGATAVFAGSDRIKAQNYFDLVLTARIGDHYQFRLGANNIMDKIPPVLVTPAPFGNGNTYPQVYDSLGRYIFAGVTLDF